MDLIGDGLPGEKSFRQKVVEYSVSAGVGVILLGVVLYLVMGMVQLGGALFILGVMISVLPYGILSFLRNRQIKEMEGQFPAFLNGLAESKRGGMTLLDAFESAHNTDYGRLNREIDRVYNELSWGIPFPEVMERFSERVEDSAVMQNSISIIIQSFESGGNITHTIDSVADEASDLRNIVKSKNSQLKQQMMIMYMIYLLFIGITIGLYFLLDMLLGMGTQGGGAFANIGKITGSGGQSIKYCTGQIPAAIPFCQISKVFGFIPSGVNLASKTAQSMGYGKMAYYKSLLFSMLIIQGLSTSAVAGKITQGKASAGIKHAIIMIPLAFIAFMLIVAPMGV
ncbi:MAG: type II secretion system F family protein [Candidatus Nanohalobium sp.]